MARAPTPNLTAEMRRFADLLRAEGVQARFSFAGRGGEPSSPRVKVRIEGGERIGRHVSMNVRRSPERFIVVVDEYETDEDGLIEGPRELETHTVRGVYQAEQIFSQLVAKYRGRKMGPVGERDERYRVPLPNPSGTTPFILQRSVVAIAEKNPSYSLARVFAIATAASQRAGYLCKSTRDVTVKGRRKEREYTAEQKATIERAFEKLVAKG